MANHSIDTIGVMWRVVTPFYRLLKRTGVRYTAEDFFTDDEILDFPHAIPSTDTSIEDRYGLKVASLDDTNTH